MNKVWMRLSWLSGFRIQCITRAEFMDVKSGGEKFEGVAKKTDKRRSKA